jgi:hypothetical protein
MAMLRRSKLTFAAAVLVAVCAHLAAQTVAPVLFTVSMPQPANRIFHVNMRVTGVAGETQDFKMPVWTPGYYRVIDYAKNVSNLRAHDAAGHELAWEKTTRNTWRIVTAGALPPSSRPSLTPRLPYCGHAREPRPGCANSLAACAIGTQPWCGAGGNRNDHDRNDHGSPGRIVKQQTSTCFGCCGRCWGRWHYGLRRRRPFRSPEAPFRAELYLSIH